MDIERQIKEIKEAENMRKEFSANVSHELKTPLTTISGYAELMKDGLVKPEDMPRFSATIYDEARRLISMIEGIIKLSRLDENRVQLDWENVDLYELAFTIKMILQEEVRKKRSQFIFEEYIQRSEEFSRFYMRCSLTYVKMRSNIITKEEKSYLRSLR